MQLTRWNPSLNTLSRWPNIWDDEDFSSLSSIGNQLDVSAEVDHGVVTVTFSKAEASKPKKLLVKAKNK